MIKLYDYQIDAIKNMKNGCILNGGVGTGKSRTSLGYYYIENGGSIDSLSNGKYVKMKEPRDLYIITTARKRDTLEWAEELPHFLMSTCPEASAYPKQNIVIDSWNNIKKYVNVYGAFFIFDEQRLVGTGTWVKTFLKIAKKNRWILLSATPGDTWQDYIPVFVANGFYKNKTEFIEEHVVYSRFSKYPKIDRYIGTNRLIRYRDSILIDMKYERGTTAHHLDIRVLHNRDEYKSIVKLRWDPWKNKPFKNAAEMCYALRKFTNMDPSRANKLLEVVHEKQKVIVFYNFDYELDILQRLDYGPKVEVAEWNGHKHQPIPDSKSWVYLVQYTAGAEGWNCIKTDTIVFYSQNYSYKTMEQASGRIDRLNTPFTDLYYYHFRSNSDIDLAIGRALKSKKKFNETKYVSKFKEV